MAVRGVHVQQECQYLDLNSLLECNIQRFILLLQLILGMQRIVSAFPHSNIDTGRLSWDLAGIRVRRSPKSTIHYQVNCILQLSIALHQQAAVRTAA